MMAQNFWEWPNNVWLHWGHTHWIVTHTYTLVTSNHRLENLDTWGETKHYSSKNKIKWLLAIVCCTRRSVHLITHHQRIFLLQKKGTDDETNRQTLFSERVLGTHSSWWDSFIKVLHSELREPCGTARRKSIRARRDGGHQREQGPLNHLNQAHMHSQWLKQQAWGWHRSVSGAVHIYLLHSF